MARKARCRSSLNMYHIIIRGINKQTIFIDNQDKTKMINELSKTKEKFNFKLYAYVIMPNHVHLVIKEGDTNISKIMHRIQLSYSEYLNIKYKRIGAVFQGRFNSKNIEDEEYLKYVIRYIHLNPDKAGIDKYDNYEWSSYREYMRNIKDGLTDTSDILDLFKNSIIDPKAKFEKFHKEKSRYQYTNEDTEFEILNRLDDDTLMRIIENMEIQSIYDIQKYNNEYRDEILGKLIRIKGTTASQISRITGISIRIVEKVRSNIKRDNLSLNPPKSGTGPDPERRKDG